MLGTGVNLQRLPQGVLHRHERQCFTSVRPKRHAHYRASVRAEGGHSQAGHKPVTALRLRDNPVATL